MVSIILSKKKIYPHKTTFSLGKSTLLLVSKKDRMVTEEIFQLKNRDFIN